MRYYFIVNPHSQTDQGLEIWERQLLPELEARDLDWKVICTRRGGDCTRIMRALTSRLREPFTAVIIGGDGTLNEAVNGIENFEYLTLGFIPIGSSNDFARGMGFQGTPAEMLRGILDGEHIRMLDYGAVKSGDSAPQRFLVSSGIGFDACVTDEALTSPIKNVLNTVHLGKLTYTVIAVQKLIQLRLQPAVLTVDGRNKYMYRRMYFASSHNLPYEGGGFKFTPAARPDDGLLNVCVVTGIPKPLVLLCLPTAYFGWHLKVPGIDTFPCRSIHIEVPNPYPVHTDGETYHPRTEVDVWCEPGRLRFVY